MNNSKKEKVITLVASGFVQKLYTEWKHDCSDNYNDIHWLKIWTDHLKAQMYDNMISTSFKLIEDTNNDQEVEKLKEKEIMVIGDGGGLENDR